MLFLILDFDLWFILYHFKYSDAFLSLKSAERSINIFFDDILFDIFWASPFGRAVNTTSTSFK